MKSISKKIMYILSVVFVVCGMLLIMPGPLSADSVVELAGNYKVENLPGGLSGFEIDGNNVALGQYPSGSPVIEITQVFYKDGGSEAIGIQWNVISGSNAKIFIVAMKASNGYMLYTYDSPGATSGSNYTPLNSTNGKNYAISHIVFGYTIPNVTTAGIIINKAILGGNAATGVFSFNVYAAGSGGSPINGSPLTISITNGVSGTTTFTSASLIAGTTYYVEELATTGFTQNTANRVAVLAATSPASPANAAAFENTPNIETGGIIITKVTGGTLSGTFDFNVLDAGGNIVGTASIDVGPGGTNSAPAITGLVPGLYTVVETTTGTFTASYSVAGGVVTVVAAENAVITVLNTPPGVGGSGTVIITKNIDAIQAAAVTFTFTLSGTTYGTSTHTITIPAGSASASITITPLPYGPYTVSEDGVPIGWALVDSANTSFNLSGNTPTVNPSFTNSTVTPPPPPPVITVAGIQTGGIDVLGIQSLPFTGDNSYLAIIGSIMLVLGLTMITMLSMRRKKSKSRI